MSNKLKIFSFPDKNPEYLQLQIDSYRIYMEDENTEFIVINASTNHEAEVYKICELNNIQCIKYTGPNLGFSDYYVQQLNWFRDNIQRHISDNIMLIHSDMFFINKLDYKTLMLDKEIYINPQYRDNNSLYYMWDGVLLFNSEYINSNKLTDLFIWDSIIGVSDMGGKTNTFLSLLDATKCGFFEFWNIYSINDNILDTHLNGNIRFTFDINERKLREAIPMGNKSFPYEDEKENYNDYYIDKLMEVKHLYSDKYNFPHPIYFDVIQIKNGELSKAPILHLKSGSGYQSWNNDNYVKQKLQELEKMIKNNE